MQMMLWYVNRLQEMKKRTRTGTVSTILRAVTTPHGRYAIRVFTLELVWPASVVAVDLIRT